MNARYSCNPNPHTHTRATSTSFSRRLTTPSLPPSATRCSRGENAGAQASGVTTRVAAKAPLAPRASASHTAVGKGARSPTAAGAHWRGPRARAARTAVVRGRDTMQAKHMCSSMDARHSFGASNPTPHPQTPFQLLCNGDVLLSATSHTRTALIRHALLPGCKRLCAGKRCDFTGCPKAARGNSTKCAAHGGGKRCSVPDCNRSAVAGPTGTCSAHGGGEGPRHHASKAHVYQHERTILL